MMMYRWSLWLVFSPIVVDTVFAFTVAPSSSVASSTPTRLGHPVTANGLGAQELGGPAMKSRRSISTRVRASLLADLEVQPLPFGDPSQVEIIHTDELVDRHSFDNDGGDSTCAESSDERASQCNGFPFALMMQGSAKYIAAHSGQIAVFHIPGELVAGSQEQELRFDKIISDISLAWLLGMKIVLVVGCPNYDLDEYDMDLIGNPNECMTAMKVVDERTLRALEEDCGFLRTEVERKLNRCLKVHGLVNPQPGSSSSSSSGGNVVSGHFYKSKRYGTIGGHDFKFAGFASNVNVDKIKSVLDNNDVVLLSTLGLTAMGDLVSVNGYHLSATVASALSAYKLIYMTNNGSVLRLKGQQEPIQEVPLSFVQTLTDHYQMKVHDAGFATFSHLVGAGQNQRATLDEDRSFVNGNQVNGAASSANIGACATSNMPRYGIEMLLHLSWAAWALQRGGVKRAHIVNPTDGAILEELFTSKNGANTCIYHDDELKQYYRESFDSFDDFMENQVVRQSWQSTSPSSLAEFEDTLSEALTPRGKVVAYSS